MTEIAYNIGATQQTTWREFAVSLANQPTIGVEIMTAEDNNKIKIPFASKSKPKGKFYDIENQRFSMWHVLAYAGVEAGSTKWWCRCDCGTYEKLNGFKLRSGASLSCGCISRHELVGHALEKCSVNRCENQSAVKGLCYPHYNQKLKTGDTRLVSYEKRWFFEDLINNPTNECVLWPFGKTSAGYGAHYVNSKYVGAHRHALVLLTGRNPKDMNACHGPCHNRLCVNPHSAHGMYWGTDKQNLGDRLRDGTQFYGEKTPSAKLKNIEALDIYKRRQAGESVKNIALEYPQVSYSTVQNIAKGNGYRRVLAEYGFELENITGGRE